MDMEIRQELYRAALAYASAWLGSDRRKLDDAAEWLRTAALAYARAQHPEKEE